MNMPPEIEIILTRQSVCAGDDCLVPHEKKVKIYPFLDPKVFCREISKDYLPSVSWAGCYWTCELNGIKIAEITHTEIRPLIQETPFSEKNFVHFIFHSG